MTWLIVLIVIVVLLALVGLFLYNGLIKKRNRVENAWSQIDVQLKRRQDLIPNLVETVKGYAAHERGTLDAVVQARNAAASATGPVAAAQADNQITGALRQLFALSEAYPDLKADTSFLALQEELSATEGKVAYALAVLQRLRPRLQHRHPDVPGRPHRRPDGLPAAGVLRSWRRGP